MQDVFISYSTKDQAAKDEMIEILQKAGLSYWLDEFSLGNIGENLNENIEEGLRNTRCTVFLVSENSLGSIWVCKEALFRLMQENFHQTNTLLPVLLDNKAFEDDFIFEVSDALQAELDKQESNREKAKARNMNTKLFDVKIDRLKRILPNVTDIFHKLREGLSANFADAGRKPKDIEKLIQTIKNKVSEADTATPTNTTLKGSSVKNITQNAEKIYNIEKIDKADFS
ncbi:MAG: toll/interleukin-1 receptor domain-containing protein [Microscillaceae bacterium]|jgi:hypothetical protein|nr:toll/interleukin-1 receptor domain-containing protein [Microscillaceae bacterium]